MPSACKRQRRTRWRLRRGSPQLARQPPRLTGRGPVPHHDWLLPPRRWRRRRRSGRRMQSSSCPWWRWSRRDFRNGAETTNEIHRFLPASVCVVCVCVFACCLDDERWWWFKAFYSSARDLFLGKFDLLFLSIFGHWFLWRGHEIGARTVITGRLIIRISVDW